MPSKALNTPDDLQRWIHFLDKQSFPMTVSQTPGAKRTNPQNRTINMWYAQIAAEMDQSNASDVRAECKLQFGVPILRRDNDAFRIEYDESFKALPYGQKRRIFKALEPAVTSIMTTKQLAEYMNAMQEHFHGAGIALIDPELRKYEVPA